MHEPEPVLENETHKIFWDFEIETDHLISTRKSDLVLVNKGKKSLVYWILPSWWTTE